MEVLSIFLILLTALLIPGITGMTKAKIAGRKMPSVFQPIKDIIRLFKKGAIYSTSTSFIYKVAPLVYLSSVSVSILFLSVGSKISLISFHGDFLLFAYLLAIGKFFMIISAMDTGSSFEGMGANREALYSMLVEPAFFIIIASLALFTDYTSLNELFSNMHISSNFSYVIGIAASYVLLNTAMTENSRMPVDDPKTHLELTMIHEVMILDNSGFDLAIIHISSWLKFSIYGTLISKFIIVTTLPFYIQAVYFIIIQMILAIVIGFLESFRARNKMEKNPQWIIMLSAIAIVAFLSTLIISQKIILN
ncbi:MAG: NADH-quinone oxidoreductase subunit H [Bacteroidota bacterium]